MIRIASSASFQPVSIQATEQTEIQSSPGSESQPQVVENAQTTAASSLNSWQRAGLTQDGKMLHVELQNELSKQNANQDSYQKMMDEVQKSKEAREDKGGEMLWGSIFGGPIIGTLIGSSIGSETNDDQEMEGRENKTAAQFSDLQSNVSPLEIVSTDVSGKYFSDTDPDDD